MKAMIFAAGLGTRLGELTTETPKALVQIAGKPLLQHALEYLHQQGFSEFIVNVHHHAGQIIRFLEENQNLGLTMHISDERDCLLDTGGGLKKARPLLEGKGPVLLYNVDVLTNLRMEKLLEEHLRSKALATLVVRDRATSRYLTFDRDHNLTGWINRSSGEEKICRPDSYANSSPYAFSGIQLIHPEIFNYITEDGKFSVTDMYLRLAQKHPVKAYIDHSDFWMDLGKPDQLALAEKWLSGHR